MVFNIIAANLFVVAVEPMILNVDREYSKDPLVMHLMIQMSHPELSYSSQRSHSSSLVLLISTDNSIATRNVVEFINTQKSR